MNKVKETLLISVSILISAVTYAQTTVLYQRGSTQMEDIMPPTPEAAVASRYADVPFSHSDGAASYSVPVYTLQGRELSIPISLEYRSSGIKLDEVAGVAGLGWTLRAGGCITREVVFMPDEYTNGSFHYELPSDQLLGWLQTGSQLDSCNAWLQKVMWNRIDCNPDRYHYSVCGLSGSFIIRPDGEIMQLDGDGVLIAYDSSSRVFTITGPDGTVYRLADREQGARNSASFDLTPFSGQQPVWSGVNTAWYVSTITSPSGAETATFSYTSGGTWNRDTYNARRTISFSNMDGPISESSSFSASTTASSYTTKRLASISLDGYTASFSYASVTGHPTRSESGSTGLQYNYPSRLTGITVSTGITELLHMNVGTKVDTSDGRVILSTLKLYHGSTLDDRWTFTYDTRTTTVSRYSQDWFGFYNAENESGSGLQPGNPRSGRNTLCPYSYNSGSGIQLSYGTPNAAAASYMSLLRADHDGAVTAWTYEGATARVSWQEQVPVGVRVRRISVLDGTDTVRVRSFSYDNPQADGPVTPAKSMYITSSAAERTTNGSFIRKYFTWSYTLHESPVVDGVSIGSTRVRYGTVTEDITGPLSSADTDGTVLTVYTFDTPNRIGYNTIDRYPAFARSKMQGGMGLEQEALYYGYAQDGYRASGPEDEAAQLSRTDYSWKTGTINYSIVREEQTQYNALQRPAVFTGYKVTQIMTDASAFGSFNANYLYHYPLWTYRTYGRVPTSITSIDHRLNGNDTTSFSLSHTNRDASLLKPWRIYGTSMTGNDRDLHVSYYYPDNVSIGRTAWMDTLTAHHRLSTPVRTEYSRYRRVVVTYPVGPPNLEFRDRSTLLVSKDYDSYGGHWLPSATVETIDSVERWREDILSRDSHGNVTSLKQKGKPRTDISWDTSKRYPVSITEGAGSASPLITQYHWIPGIGPDVVTDPAGQKTYYYYDAAGRLTSVRDTDGKLVSDYTYSLLSDGNARRHVRARTYRDANGATSTSDYTYWNALGMHLQDIALNATGDGIGGLVSSFEGDFMLHDDVKSWLPYPASGSTGAYLSDAIGLSITYHGSTKAYSFKGYELSALDRVRSEAEPGYAGSHDSVTGEFVRDGFPIYKWDDESGAIVQLGTYPSSQVVMEVIQDADARQAISLRDRTGRLLATYHRDDPEDTPETHYGALILGVRTDPVRYVYDGKDRLRAVVRPGLSLTDTLNMWRYSYDALGRLASKGYPGSAVREFYTYDSEDRIVRIVRGTDVTESDYDALGRVTAVRRAAPDGVLHLVETHTYTGPYETGRRLSLIAPDGTPGDCNVTGGYVDYAFTYDNKGRVISTQATWPDGETQVETTGYDFSSQPTAVTLTATRPGGATTQLSTLTQYDLRERPTRTITVLSLNGTPAVQDTTNYSYDAIGRPAGTSSSSGGSSVSSTLSYTLQGRQDTKIYRIGGRKLFSEELKYEDPGISGFEGSYSGKITGKVETWHGGFQVPPQQVALGTVGHTAYKYDYIGRLKDVGSFSLNTIQTVPANPTIYGTIFNYDERGNILRDNPYIGNAHAYGGHNVYDRDKLVAIISDVIHMFGGIGYLDTLAVFSYDDHARMVHDGLAGADYSYNALGLLRKVERADSIVANYCYLADGTKAVAEREDGSGLVYRGSLTYRKDSTGVLTLESAPSPTGRITPSGMRYHVTDHLGSVRAVIDGQSGAILEAGNYGVYGGRGTAATNAWPTATVSAGETLRDHFSGKEDQTPDFNLGLTDFGARSYSPYLSRWLTPDPLSEKYYDVSPYAYCAGDPVNVLDREGDDIVIKGKNSSTLTFRTSINKDVNLSSIDFKGNYNLEGKDALGAALDIIGIFDQTGIADGANAALQLSQGDFGSAALSALAVAPVIGDLSKIGKATKDVRILSKAIVEAGGSPIFRSFTKSNFRENLIRRTGVNPKGMDAHHTIPKAKEFQKNYDKAGINIHDPKYGTWLESNLHRSTSSDYNNQWRLFFRGNPDATKEEIENFASYLMQFFYGE